MREARMRDTLNQANQTAVSPQLPPSAETPEGKQHNESKGTFG